MPYQQRQTQNLKYLLKMKKITFILFALIAGTSFAQEGNATSVVNAEIISPIQITSTGPLEFGKLAAPTADTDIIVNTTGVRTAVTGVTLAGTPTTAASFNITAANTFAYNITLTPTDLDIFAGGGTIMPLVLTSSLGTSSTGTGSAQALTVGGTLTVNASQPVGVYDGQVEVTVNYN